MCLKKLILAIWLMAIFCLASLISAENIDPNEDDSQYAWGENIGWVNFESNQGPGVQVSSSDVTGYVWGENIGWISLSCENTSSCGTVSYGITNDEAGNISGYAWGENVGWINFDPNVPGDSNDYGVTIDADGAFDGYAWAENIGWINFGIADNYVVVCKVTFEDLANFTSLWLQTGTNAADLDGEADDVDFEDYGIFSSVWQDFCPDGWQLK